MDWFTDMRDGWLQIARRPPGYHVRITPIWHAKKTEFRDHLVSFTAARAWASVMSFISRGTYFS
ncbi:hypothetical protein ABTL28_19330, partial [Acinetobacter baumannii]